MADGQDDAAPPDPMGVLMEEMEEEDADELREMLREAREAVDAELILGVVFWGDGRTAVSGDAEEPETAEEVEEQRKRLPMPVVRRAMAIKQMLTQVLAAQGVVAVVEVGPGREQPAAGSDEDDEPLPPPPEGTLGGTWQ